jgi:hypothetical protein
MTDLDEYEETEAIEPRGVHCDSCEEEEPFCEECSQDFSEGDTIYCAGDCEHLCKKCYLQKQKEAKK